MWTAKLRDNYRNKMEWTHYSMMYGLAKRLGFRSAKATWEANPTVQGSTDPRDFCIVKKRVKLLKGTRCRSSVKN